LEFATDLLHILDFEGDMSDPASAIVEFLQDAAFVRNDEFDWRLVFSVLRKYQIGLVSFDKAVIILLQAEHRHYVVDCIPSRKNDADMVDAFPPHCLASSKNATGLDLLGTSV